MKKGFTLSKKLISILAALAIIVSSVGSLSFISVSAGNSDIWDGTIATGFAGGTGTATDPYQISNGAQLAYLASKSATFELDTRWKYYILTNDIVLNDTTSPNWKTTAKQWVKNNKGLNGWGFSGTLDGNGHTVSGLYLTDSTFGGLFPKMDAGATVKNLGIINSYISGTNVGAFVGATCVGGNPSNNNKLTFINCFADNTVEINGIYVGGFVGQGQVIYSLTNCYFTGNLTGTKSRFGAAVGDTWWANGGLGDVYVNGCYTTVSKWLHPYAEKNTNSYKSVTAKGESAKTAMPNLDWDVFKTKLDTYPVLKIFDSQPDDSDENIWDGTTATSFAGGDGSQANPYQISNGSELIYLVKQSSGANANSTKGKFYVLTKDIVLNKTDKANWTDNAKSWYVSALSNPAGSWGFRGTLDGNYHTISGLYVNSSTNAGLFPMLDGGAQIKNLGITNSVIKGAYSGAFGGVFGFANGTSTITFRNCFADSTVTISATDTAGGLVGWGSNYIQMTNCYFAGSVSGTTRTGGLVGHMWWSGSCGDFKYTNCYTTASNYISCLADLNKPTAPNYCGVTATGESAKTAMPDLDWEVYKTKDNNYPIISAFEGGTPGGEEPEKLWDTSATEFAAGDGTQGAPYQITNGSELYLLVKTANLDSAKTENKYYIIMNDIVLNDTSSSNWTKNAQPWYSNNIGGPNEWGFRGFLDGQGHTVSGLYVNGGNSSGLFTQICGGTISNLGIVNSYVKGTNAVGAFVGTFGNYNGKSSALNNCFADETVTVEGAYVGGLVGWGLTDLYLNNCYYTGTISGTKVKTGGLVGNVWWSGSAGTVRLHSCYTTHSNYVNTFPDLLKDDGTNYCNVTSKGNDAKTQMPKLDWKLAFKTKDDEYPILRIFTGEMPVDDGIWNGMVASGYNNGDGSKEHPFEIANGSQLALLATTAESNPTATEGKYYVITQDIVLNDTSKANWKDDAYKWVATMMPANVFAYGFRGNLDGQGHKITGLYGTNCPGIFRSIDGGASISHLYIDDADIKGTYTGALAGTHAQFGGKSITINQVYVGENVTVNGTYAGGIIGWGDSPMLVKNCAFVGSVSGTAKFAGIVADSWSNTVSVSGSFTSSTKLTGGVSGNADSTCYANITKDKGYGNSAKTNMPSLDWNIWKVVDGKYPDYISMEDVYYEGKVGEIWSGKLATKFASGDGTKENPYKIATPEQLAYLVNTTLNACYNTEGKYYEIVNDLILNDTSSSNWTKNARLWYSVIDGGFSPNGFRGTLNGNGHTIKGIYINATSEYSFGGLFYKVDAGAMISGVIIDNSYISASRVGAIAGGVPDYNNKSVTINQCYAKEGVTISGNYAGGIVGWSDASGLYKNCAFTGNITNWKSGNVSKSQKSGGILCDAWGKASTISGCFTSYLRIHRATTGSADSTCYDNITKEQGYGNSAKINMPLLDWSVWKVNANGYPEYKEIKEVYGDGKPGEAWTGKIATEFAGGKGTKDDPYRITTAEQLAYFVNICINNYQSTEGKYYSIENDIILNDTLGDNSKSWFSVKDGGFAANGFCGTLDGNGHTIKGLYINADGEYVYGGLIPKVNGGAMISGIIISNSYIKAGRAGAITGGIPNYNSKTATINQCYVTETTTVEGLYAGGIIGWCDSPLYIKNCACVGNVRGSKKSAGILCDCWTNTAIISACFTSDKKIHSASTANADGACYTSISKEKGYGNAAKTYMPKLNWDIWKINSKGYPTFKFIDYPYDEGKIGRAWSGKIASGFAGGKGTKESPYQIATPEQLAYCVTLPQAKTEGKYFEIIENIVINDTAKSNWKESARDWFTAKQWGDSFRGKIDGKAHTVSGLYVNVQGTGLCTALFPRIGYGAEIKKIGLIHSSVAIVSSPSEAYAAGFAGYIDNVMPDDASSDNYPRISQCFADTSVYIEGAYAGGIVCGVPGKVIIQNCYFVGVLKANSSDKRAGGIIGNNWEQGSIIENCYSHTRIKQPMVAGRPELVTVKDSYSTGKVFGGGRRVSHSQIIGEKAKTSMPNLDYKSIWKTVKKGTPILQIFDNVAYSDRSTPEKISVSFSSNCDQKFETLYGIEGDPITLPTPKDRPGYKFAGWYVFKELDVPFTYGKFPAYNITLYAKWDSSVLTQNFEKYPATEWDMDDDFELYKPGVAEYSAKNVKDGSKSLHLKETNSGQNSFLIFDSDKVEKEQEYTIEMWVKTDSDSPSGEITLSYSDHNDIWEKKVGADTISNISELSKDKWKQVKATFTAQGEYLVLNVKNGSSIYFDGIVVTPTGNTGVIKDTAVDQSDDNAVEKQNTPIIIIVSVCAIVLIASVISIIIVLKRKKKIS